MKIGKVEGKTGLLHYGIFREMRNKASHLVDYEKIIATGDYRELIFEIYFTFLKMELERYSLTEKEEVAVWIMKVMYGAVFCYKYEALADDETS